MSMLYDVADIREPASHLANVSDIEMGQGSHRRVIAEGIARRCKSDRFRLYPNEETSTRARFWPLHEAMHSIGSEGRLDLAQGGRVLAEGFQRSCPARH